MFFHNIIKRRLSSLLQPWLQEELDMEIQLGFINSVAIAKNLRFNVLSFNQLMDDSSCFSFKEFTIEQFVVRFSSWSAPAFAFEFSGVHVTLSAEEVKEEGLTKRQKPSDAASKSMKRELSMIDPEGSALHDILEGILAAACPRHGVKSSFCNLILQHCCIQILSISLQLQSPILKDSFSYLLEVKELNAESQHFDHACLCRGLLSLLFLPLKESSLFINGNGFVFGYKRSDQINHVCYLNDPSMCIKLNDLELEKLNLQIPELTFFLSPVDVPVFLALEKLLSKKSSRVRNGRLLWRLAATKIGKVISAPRLSWYNLIRVVGLWLHYVNTYGYLLYQLGYPSNHLLRRSAIKLPKDKMFLGSVKNKWEEIYEIEKEVPLEAIAQARRIGRYKTASGVQHAEDCYREHFFKRCFKSLWNILPLLIFTWKGLGRMLQSTANLFFSRKISTDDLHFDDHLGYASEYSSPHSCFILSLGKMLITICPTNTVQPVNEEVYSHIGMSHSDVVSFRLSIKVVLLMYVKDTFEQSLSISCGKIKVKSFISSVRREKGRLDELKTILHGEPAKLFLLTETNKAVGNAESNPYPSLDKIMGDMWLSWKRVCKKFEESEIKFPENPRLLCELKNFLIHPDLKKEDSGLWKCSLAVGKFKITLDFSSVLSIVIFLNQIQQALCWTQENERATVLSCSTQNLEDQQEVSWNKKYQSHVSRMKMTFLSMFPKKDVRLGVYIAGPSIRISLRKTGIGHGNEDVNHHTINQDDFHVGLDIHSIEIVVWPTSKSDLGSLNGVLEMDEEDSETPRLQEPQIIDVSKLLNERHTSQKCILLGSYLRLNGLNVYIEDLSEKQQNQFFVLKPIVFQLSSFRKCVHSFSTTFNAFSVAFCGMAMGLTTIACMDELYALSQVLSDFFSTILYAFHSFGSIGNLPFQMFQRPNNLCGKPETKEITEKTASLICNDTLFLINGNFKLKSVDVFLHNSRTSKKAGSSVNTLDASKSKKPARLSSDCGIWISVQKMCFEMSQEERKLELIFDLSEIQFVIIRYQEYAGTSFDCSLRDVLLHSDNCLYEVSLSHCVLTLWLTLPQNASSLNETVHSISESSASCTVENHDPESSSQSCGFVQNLDFGSNIQAPTSGHWMAINIAMGEVFVTGVTVKNILIGAQQFTKLLSSLSIGGNFQTISWGIQGGFLCLEATALSMIIQYFASYLHRIIGILSLLESIEKHMTKAERNFGEHARGALPLSYQGKWELLEAFTIDVSRFSLVFVVEDESGGIQEFILEVDLIANFELENMRRKFMFELSRLSIFSQSLKGTSGNEIQIPHFFPARSNGLSSSFLSGDSSVPLQHRDGSGLVDESFSNDVPVNKSVTEVFHLSHQHYILKHLGAFVSMEKLHHSTLQSKQVWAGSGSASGFDMTISLSELQMILAMVSSFFVASGKNQASESLQGHWSGNQEIENSFEAMVPDGAVVAIQDVNQHLYFTVEGGLNKYTLVGALHYSLVGERALFRVKYHGKRKWNSSVLLFSLVSLHAKNDLGEPLRINYRPGSGFVDISSATDNAFAVWRTLSCEPEIYQGDFDWEPYNRLLKNTFYLVNKKNDCAVAFVDGTPEFVRKPGNPFKFKVLTDLSISHDVVTYSRCLLNSSTTRVHLSSQDDGGITDGQSRNLPCVGVTIDKVSLTIVHELSDAKDRFPLLSCCINNTQLILQILSTKARVMSTSNLMIHYFDAHTSLWRELLHPVEICSFYRSTFENQDPEAIMHGVPVHIYCRTKELAISLTELSLDILLFVIGKLDLAGPFSVSSSMILANCCKVENKTGLNLLCNFYSNQTVTVGRKQSASIFLRHSDLANQPPEIASLVSVKLSVPGSFTTSPIQLSLLETQALAWRTRIVSPQDSRTYPGPFVVFDISRTSEDGLSVVVSPLIRIHNETEFPFELRFRRPEQTEGEFAFVSLKSGDTVDDSVASFDAVNLSGGLKKALMSLSIGKFLFAVRPEMPIGLINSNGPLTVEWSDELKGGTAVRLSGIFDKLRYEVRKALSVESVKCSFSTAHCTLRSADGHDSDLHFLIQSIGREVPIIQPDKSRENRNSPIALQEQKEIFFLPTMRVSNLLHSEIHVLLTETNVSTPSFSNIGKRAIIPCGSTADFYANPAMICFSVTLTAFSSSCKPLSSSEWIKKLPNNTKDVRCLDIDLDFGGGKYFASLRLSRGYRGILEASIYTSYTVKNDTEFSLYFFPFNQKKPLSRNEIRDFGSSIPPALGLFLPPKSAGSWFLKSHKVRLRLLEEHASEAVIDMDALSGPTEESLEIEEESGVKYIMNFGVSTGPSLSKLVPSQTVTVVPRHVILNESEESITVRQCYLEDDMAGMISINSKQRTALQLRNELGKRKEYSPFENFIRKHRNDSDNSLTFIQFQLNESQLDWSGPLCISSLGCFFLKFRKQSDQVAAEENKVKDFAAVHVVEEGSTIVVKFHKPPNGSLPYRIENRLSGVSLTYYQKDSSEPEVLQSECSVDYVWDDLTLPHRLVIVISNMNLLREINLDKVRTWKPFYKITQHLGLASHSQLRRKTKNPKSTIIEYKGINMPKVGYEVYAEGQTRVLRICELSESHMADKAFHSCAKLKLRVSQFAIHLLEQGKQNASPPFMTFVVARFQNIVLDSVYTELQKYNQIYIQSLNIDEKWVGAPFAAMLRGHRLDYGDANDCILKIFFVLLSGSSDVRQVKYSSIVLQPLDLKVDEDTLMKIVSFWRKSLSDSNTPSRQFYFDHFEIHPIKIFASFLPGESYSSYNSAQETLRSLLHSVVKVPPIKNMVVELNGVLVTHALITMRELFIRCAQHYSWYAMRAIYIAKGSPLLPPAFSSIFDDLASSSLDVFFDPSQGFMNLPGTFKFISKCIDGKGFSGTKRYFGDLGATLKTAGSNVIFAAVTEISDSVLKGAETSGFNGMVNGFHQGILKLAMEPSVLGTALMGGGPDRRIKLDQSPGVDELYIEGYLQAMLDTMYRQEYLRVRVIDDQVFLKNLPPNSSLIDEIMDRVKGFLISKGLLKGDPSATSHPLRHFRGENEWKIGPTVVTLCEHLFVSFAIRMLRKQASKFTVRIKWKESEDENQKAVVAANSEEKQKVKFIWKWGIAKFVLSGILAYLDGRLCRCIPNPVARRIVSGFVLSFLDKNDGS